jgi:flavin reductase (DIM6/NTAB) family NADH-FMN oxidoreductase RutF
MKSATFHHYPTLVGSNHAQPRMAGILSCGRNLMAVSWHMPISREPFRYAVAVRPENFSHELITKSGAFALNFLPFSYYEEVDLTGRLHGDTEDKLARTHLAVHGTDPHGNVLLEAADFIYQCEVCDTYQNGDHTIFMVDVKQIDVNTTPSVAPMLFMGRGRYTSIAPILQVEKPS